MSASEMSASASTASAAQALMAPWAVEVDLESGVMPAPDRVLVRRASDMRGYYRDAAALERLIASGDPIHYEVFEKLVPECSGHLMICVSRLRPGTVGDECFMTKGHFHSAAGTAEIYLGLRGAGYMLLKTTEDAAVLTPIRRHRAVYVPPYWAHRSINTGDEPLISFCVYPAEAGHNYGDIAAKGFPTRVFQRGGKEVIEESRS